MGVGSVVLHAATTCVCHDGVLCRPRSLNVHDACKQTLREDQGAKATTLRDATGKVYEVYRNSDDVELEVKYFDFRLLLLKVYSASASLREAAVQCVIGIVAPHRQTVAPDFSATVNKQTVQLISICEDLFPVLGAAALDSSGNSLLSVQAAKAVSLIALSPASRRRLLIECGHQWFASSLLHVNAPLRMYSVGMVEGRERDPARD